MRHFKSYLGLMVSAAMALGFASCQDDFDAPAPDSFVHTATISANTSILDLKAKYWKDSETNYVTRIGTLDNGDHIIISGRVASSDYTGNIYKTLILQDASAAITISIDATSLYAKYPMGQEVVIDVTDMFIGKYNGLMQLGYESDGGINRMPLQFFEQHAQLNGSAYIKEADGTTRMNPVDTTAITIAEANSVVSTQADLRKWQSRLVKFTEVSFVGGGEDTYATLEQTEKRYITDENGNQLMVYNSGYSNFWSEVMPSGTGDVTGILSYYAASGWQLLLIDTRGCAGFDGSARPGSQENPYTVDQAIQFEIDGSAKRGWVAGYIVGAVHPDILGNPDEDKRVVTSNNDIEWGPEAPTNGTTLVIANAPDVHDINQCLVFDLPNGSTMAEYANLQQHPENYNKRMTLIGTFNKVYGTYGLTGNNGTSHEFTIEGVDVPADPSITPGSASNPYTVEQIIAKNPSSASIAVETGVWVSGYIVGWGDASESPYTITADKAYFTADGAAASNLLMASDPNCKDVNKCIAIQLPSGSTVRSALNLKDNPGNIGKPAAVKGNVVKYCGLPGMKETSEYTLDGQGGTTPNPPAGDVKFTLASSVTSGKGYMLYTSGMYATPLNATYNYGYLYGTAVTETSGEITSSASNAYTLTATDGGYFLSDSYGRYLYMSGSFDSFNVSTDATKGDAAYIWTVDFQTDGRAKITNKSNGKYIQYDPAPTTGSNKNPRFCSKDTEVAGGSLPYLYLMDGTAVAPNPPSEGGEEPGPDVPVTGNSADFNTFNDGKTSPQYTTPFTSAQGWKTENCMLIQGDNDATVNAGTTFSFIGGSDVYAPVLNGKTTTPGKLTSPTITGGLSKISFNYGFPFADTKCKFTITIKQGENVVQTKTEEFTGLTKFTSYSYSWDVNVTGDFTIEIVNDCLSASTSNKDRLAIWNLTWEN